MKRFLPIRTLTAWLCLAVILFGSGGAHLLHAIPGLGHQHDHCCHSHASHRADWDGHCHSHDGHTHHCQESKPEALAEDHVSFAHVSLANASGPQWNATHDCALCRIIAVVHQGTILVDAPVEIAHFRREKLARIPSFLIDSSLLGGPFSRGPPLS